MDAYFKPLISATVAFIGIILLSYAVLVALTEI